MFINNQDLSITDDPIILILSSIFRDSTLSIPYLMD